GPRLLGRAAPAELLRRRGVPRLLRFPPPAAVAPGLHGRRGGAGAGHPVPAERGRGRPRAAASAAGPVPLRRGAAPARAALGTEAPAHPAPAVRGDGAPGGRRLDRLDAGVVG